MEKIGRVLWIIPVTILADADSSGRKMHTFVRAIIQVDKVLLEFAGQSWGIHGITMVLAGDVALASGQIQSRNVVSTVAILELDGASTSCESKQLVTKTDTHNWDLGGLHEAAQVVHGLLAMSWITGAVGDEDTIKVMGNLMDREIIREDCDACTASNQAPQDILLDTAVDDSDVHVTIERADMKGSLGADPLDQVDLFRINESLILISVVLLSNGDPGQRRTLLAQVCDNRTGINT